jgi:hypothetical protein
MLESFLFVLRIYWLAVESRLQRLSLFIYFLIFFSVQKLAEKRKPFSFLIEGLAF